MPPTDTHRIANHAALRERIGEPNPATRQKLFDHLDEQMRAYLSRSPFCLMATTDREGMPEVSPKGDGRGFVLVEDEHSLVLPDRKGNKLLFGLQNLLENPRVGLIFLVPGTDETLRVSGRAELRSDPELLARLSARGQPALLAIRVRVERCFFHCARAFLRAELWNPESWPEPLRISFGRQIAPRLGGDAKLADAIDANIEKGRNDL
ncbi:MAG: MSMEG_1061 family FMN-dependent PPOX-type flavoprotein [Myxococcota bacterium]